MTKAWQEDWQKVTFLLQTPEFKQITVSEKRNIESKVPYEDLLSHTSKLELGVIAFLWCSGTNK